MTVMSMTGFARVDGADDVANWFWEVRSVNGRGLDVRLRLPPGSERIEVGARNLVSEKLSRGNVSLQLNQRRTASETTVVVNDAALEQILDVVAALRERLGAPPPSVEGLLGLRGVLEAVETVEADDVIAARSATQLADLSRALDALMDARRNEGRRLGEIVGAQVDRISELVERIHASPARQADVIRARISEMVARLLDEKSASFDEARLHQEAVLLATKADVEEELQRLRAHVAAARELLGAPDAVGRRLDFLTQEFNREANTICSKSNDTDVTRLGLELKAVIEQMREQVQNIE